MVELNPLRIAVIGAGSFGRNHARVYRELQQADPSVQLVAIVDRDFERAVELVEQLQEDGGAPVAAFSSVEELLASEAKPAAVSVAVPTSAHLEVAWALLNADIDLLIEKPVTTTLEEADELITLAASRGRVVQVGHLERFNPAVRATAPLVTRPMFFEVHRLSVFSPRALDVDVVLDLMIHDLDIVLALVRSPVRELRAVGIPILSDKVDIANVRLEFESGCVANFTASRVSTEKVRKLRFFQPHQYVSVDYSRQDVFTLTVEPAGEGAQAPAMPFPIPVPPGLRITPAKPQIMQEESLHAELRAFLSAVRTRSEPVVTLEDGRAALEVALHILDAIHKHAMRAGLA